MKYTATQVAGMVDHTNLKAYATDADMKNICIVQLVMFQVL